MAKAASPASLDLSHVSEVLEVAHSILQRHRDEDLTEKTFVMQEYLEMSKTYPERDYREGLNKALADLTGAVHLYLNYELTRISQRFLFRNLAQSLTGLGDCHESTGRYQEHRLDYDLIDPGPGRYGTTVCCQHHCFSAVTLRTALEEMQGLKVADALTIIQRFMQLSQCPDHHVDAKLKAGIQPTSPTNDLGMPLTVLGRRGRSG